MVDCCLLRSSYIAAHRALRICNRLDVPNALVKLASSPEPCPRFCGHRQKSPSRPGLLVALVASAALDDTAPLRNPSGLMVCAPLWGIPSDAWPAVLVHAMLRPLVQVYQSHYLLPDALLSQLLLPDVSLPSPCTAAFPAHRCLHVVPQSTRQAHGRTIMRFFLLTHNPLRV